MKEVWHSSFVATMNWQYSHKPRMGVVSEVTAGLSDILVGH